MFDRDVKFLSYFWKVLEKSGNDNKGPTHNLSLISINARSCSLPHLNPTDFLTIFVSGAASVFNL